MVLPDVAKKLLASPDGERVVGVSYENEFGANDTIATDLVVDASGTGALTLDGVVDERVVVGRHELVLRAPRERLERRQSDRLERRGREADVRYRLRLLDILPAPHPVQHHPRTRCSLLLQLCAQDNMQVVNCTTPGEEFNDIHIELVKTAEITEETLDAL